MAGAANSNADRPPQRGVVELVAAMLSPEERRVLVLRHMRKLGESQIARQLGCTRNAASALLAAAEAKVRTAQRALLDAFVETNGGKAATRSARKQTAPTRVDRRVPVQA